MRLVKVISVLVIGPFVGGVSGAIVGSLLVPRNEPPTGYISASLIHTCVGVGFGAFAVLSVLLAIRIWRGGAHPKGV